MGDKHPVIHRFAKGEGNHPAADAEQSAHHSQIFKISKCVRNGCVFHAQLHRLVLILPRDSLFELTGGKFHTFAGIPGRDVLIPPVGITAHEFADVVALGMEFFAGEMNEMLRAVDIIKVAPLLFKGKFAGEGRAKLVALPFFRAVNHKTFPAARRVLTKGGDSHFNIVLLTHRVHEVGSIFFIESAYQKAVT